VPVGSIVALFFVLAPDSTNFVANLFGIGRGIDLFTLSVIPLLLLCVLVLFRKYLDLERSLTAMVRSMAISEVGIESRGELPPPDQ